MKPVTKNELTQLLNLRFNREYLCTSLKRPDDYMMDELYLHSVCGNHYLLQRKKDFYHVDLFLNRTHPVPLQIQDVLILEYVDRRLKPEHIELIEELGFKEIMRRSSMIAKVETSLDSYTVLDKSYIDEVMSEIVENFDPHFGAIPSYRELEERFNNSEIIGILQDHRLLGFVELSKTPRAVHIEHLSVNRNCRGQGVGKRLIEQLFAYTKNCGIGNVELFVNHENKVAQAMYEKMGFKENKLESIVFRRDKYEGKNC